VELTLSVQQQLDSKTERFELSVSAAQVLSSAHIMTASSQTARLMMMPLHSPRLVAAAAADL
jgi:hypothetical protein